MTARSASASTQARANTASDSAAAICTRPLAAPSAASSSGMRRRVEHEHVRGALAQDREAREAVVVGDRDDAVAEGLERLLQHRGIAAARADDQRLRAVAARIGQRREPALDVGDEHDDRLPAAGERRQRGLAAARAARPAPPGSAHRPPTAGQAAPSLAAGAISTGSRSGHGTMSRSTSRGASAPRQSLTSRRQTTSWRVRPCAASPTRRRAPRRPRRSAPRRRRPAAAGACRPRPCPACPSAAPRARAG